MRLFIITLLFATQWATAQTLEDVIYKKDGSILRGSLIEQDFETGRYKIQLKGGSVFAVSKEDINKISKEAPLNSTASNSGAVNINIENNPTITQTPSIEQNSLVQAYSYTDTRQEEKRHSIRIGSMSKDITDSDDDGIAYKGLNIAYQYNLDEYIAFYAEYNKADLDSEIIDGENYEISSYSKDNMSFRGIEASAMLSTNNYQGWQFYAGLGIFNEKFKTFGASDTAIGTVITLGMGYDWEPVQLQFRISAHKSSDYSDEVFNTNIDLTSSNAALQLGFSY